MQANTAEFHERQSKTEETIEGDMDHIMQSLLALDKVLVERQFICGESVTMMDIIFYNELSQVLFLHNLFKKVTKQ